MAFEHILTGRSGDFATITMNRPERRNSLSLAHMRELIMAFHEIGASDALGIVLAGNGPVFSAGHDLAEVADGDLATFTPLDTPIVPFRGERKQEVGADLWLYLRGGISLFAEYVNQTVAGLGRRGGTVAGMVLLVGVVVLGRGLRALVGRR